MLWLIFIHFLFDAGLQPSWMIEAKKKNWIVLFEHCAIWTGGICLYLSYAGILHPWKVIFLFTGHYAIDLFKIRYAKNPLQKKYLLFDQILHIIQLGVVLL